MKSIITLCFCLSAIMAFTQTFNCGDTLIDTRDGQKYPTIQIGSDCWMKKNLNYGNYVPSFSSAVIHSDQTNNGTSEKYAQENNTANLTVYGGLYEGTELMNYSLISGSQGLCPSGWHVSTDAEWQNLITVAGASMITTSAGKGGNKLKLVGEGMGTGAGTDLVGIGLKHGGDRDGFGIFYGKTLRSIYWTSTITGNQSIHYMLWAEKDTIQRLQLGLATTAFSCRCVKNAGVGISELNKEIDLFHVYPNPTMNYFVINMNANFKNASYKLTNIIGQEVMAAEILEKSTLISLGLIKEGVYFLSIISDGKKMDKKIIVTK